jgi:hypothetical protein
VRYEGSRVLVRAGRGLALLVGSVPEGRRPAAPGARDAHPPVPSATFEAITDGPTAGCEVRLAGMRSRWVVRLSDLDRDESLDAFARRFAGLRAADGEGGEICLDDPDYGRVVCRPDGKVIAVSGEVDPSSWTHAGRAVVLPGGAPIPLPSHA